LSGFDQDKGGGEMLGYVFITVFVATFVAMIAWPLIKRQLIKRAARQGKNMYSETWFSSFRK